MSDGCAMHAVTPDPRCPYCQGRQLPVDDDRPSCSSHAQYQSHCPLCRHAAESTETDESTDRPAEMEEYLSSEADNDGETDGTESSLAEAFENIAETVDETTTETTESTTATGGTEVSVEVLVDGMKLDETQTQVIDTYAENIETFLRKNQDYGSSFTDSAKIESILKHGEVRSNEVPELIARQIFVRGMLDKISRFYQLAFEQDGALVGDESIDDTLLDLGNYSHMLASQLRAAEDGM